MWCHSVQLATPVANQKTFKNDFPSAICPSLWQLQFFFPGKEPVGHRSCLIFFDLDPRQLQGSSWEKWLEAKVQSTGVLNEN